MTTTRTTTPRTLEDLKLRARARLKQQQAVNEVRYKNHPWPFLQECVWTVDQVRNRVAQYPRLEDDAECDCTAATGNRCGSYLEHLVNVWVREPRLLIPKARRMMASWTMVACHYWLARYRPNSFIGIVSRKRGETDSEGSAELIRRTRLIHENLPEHVKALKLEYQFARVKLPQVGSEMVGIGQGENQLRQYTCTALLFDEFAFWEEAQATYHASFPTLEGGGRLTIISSVGPGFFKSLVHDEQA